MLISICIPTYNRPEHLKNCLSSLARQTNKNFEVCVSDNNSKTNIRKIINLFNTRLKIRFKKNKKNLGFAINLLNVSKMAKGKFIWFLGDDDLLIPNAIEQLAKRIKQNNNVDFFWINSYDLNYSHLKKFPSPFNTKNLPKKMASHSKLKHDESLVNVETMTAETIHDMVRAFTPWPGVSLCINSNGKEQMYKIWKTSVLEQSKTQGDQQRVDSLEVDLANKQQRKFLKICCADNSVLGVSELQQHGGKRISAMDFSNGAKGSTAIVVPPDCEL